MRFRWFSPVLKSVPRRIPHLSTCCQTRFIDGNDFPSSWGGVQASRHFIAVFVPYHSVLNISSKKCHQDMSVLDSFGRNDIHFMVLI